MLTEARDKIAELERVKLVMDLYKYIFHQKWPKFENRNMLQLKEHCDKQELETFCVDLDGIDV